MIPASLIGKAAFCPYSVYLKQRSGIPNATGQHAMRVGTHYYLHATDKSIRQRTNNPRIVYHSPEQAWPSLRFADLIYKDSLDWIQANGGARDFYSEKYGIKVRPDYVYVYDDDGTLAVIEYKHRYGPVQYADKVQAVANALAVNEAWKPTDIINVLTRCDKWVCNDRAERQSLMTAVQAYTELLASLSNSTKDADVPAHTAHCRYCDLREQCPRRAT